MSFAFTAGGADADLDRLSRGASGAEADSPAHAEVDEIAPRLDRLEQAVDAIAIEVERISEGQRFVTKVLSERPRATASASGSPRPDAVDGGIPDARQILALGAGPIEPIRVAERQAVRQTITPH